MAIAHIERLSPNELAYALEQIDALPLDANQKRVLKDIFLAGSNPDASKLETIIKTLPKARQAQIYHIFDEIAARQQAQSEDAAKALLLLGLLTLGSLLTAYVLTPDQEAIQAAQLLEIMKRAYVQGIQDEIDYLGVNARARQPSGAELAYLTGLANTDAASITATWNKDAAKELAQLYKDNPTASKSFFVESMRAWANGRVVQKSLSIAFNTETRAREYGRMLFMERNYPGTAKYLFKGSAPVCEDCMTQFAAGVVDFAYIKQFPCPRHPNCEHRWSVIRKPKIDASNLWVG